MHCADECVPLEWPDSPCVRVSGQENPTPVAAEELHLLVELHLSPEKLRVLTGNEDLKKVTTLELCTDTRESSLSNLGAYLPNLIQLKMNNSVITSVRDLGTSFSHLQVLWMARCGLADLDGILVFSSLKELYVAYNDISDLSHISMLEHLELLDLEGNSVDDISQVQYLGLCGSLRALILDGNPVCAQPHPDTPKTENYCYRSAVRQFLPHLHYLDDIPAEDIVPQSSTGSLEDWALLKESIKESISECLEPPGVENISKPINVGVWCGVNESLLQFVPAEEIVASAGISSRPGSAQRPGMALQPHSHPGSRPSSARPLSSTGSRPGTADLNLAAMDPGASDLTHGVGRVMCGNPGQALRARQQNMKLPGPRSVDPNPFAQLRHVPDCSYDLEEDDGKDCRDVLAELRAWREKHNKLLIAIEREHQPQVMKVSNSDAEEEEDRGSSLNSTSDEEDRENGEVEMSQWNIVGSPDSSFQSPTPGFFHDGEGFPRLPLSAEPTLFPSPPLNPIAPPGGRKALSEVRRRRLQFKVPGMESVKTTVESFVRKAGGQTSVPVHKTRDLKTHPALNSCSTLPQRPLSSPVIPRNRIDWKTEPQPTSGHHLIPDLPPRLVPLPPACPRPHTARAAIQRLPRRPVLTPERSTTHCS
ncbi:leucine-rich repeat-containing protein 56 [Arapaima gigas]